MVAGLIGVPLGSFTAQALRPRHSNIDPLVCAGGLLTSTPLVYFALITAKYHTGFSYAFMFFGELFLNLTWSIVADMLLVSKNKEKRFLLTDYEENTLILRRII